jgi:hypothetical protein
MLPCVFDGEPRLADAAQPVQRPYQHARAVGGGKRRMERFELLVAAFEQVAERDERQIAGLAGRRNTFARGSL